MGLLDRSVRWVRAAGHDADAQRELAGRALPLPPALDVQWLGTAGYRITYEGRSLLIDPYLTRAPLGDLLRRTPLLPDPALVDRHLGGVGEVVGVLVGHTHFDHAVDAPELVRRFGCPALGSSSLRTLLALHGLADRAVVVEPHADHELGPFRVRFVPSRHAKLIAGLAVPSAGELSCEHLDGLTGPAYRCGQVWGIRVEVAGTVLYHHGSADVVEDELPGGGVDVFLAGIAGRCASPGYLATMLRRLSPTAVVPGHYDDFFRPLDAPMGFSVGVNLSAFVDELESLSRTVTIATLDPVGAAVRG